MSDGPANETVLRRSRVFVAAVFFANLYLFAFGLDAALSIIDDLLQGLVQVYGLQPFRLGLAIAVLLATPLLILEILFVPHLPKRIFLPLAFCAIWANLIVWPLQVSVSDPLVNLPLSLVQFLVFAVALFLLKRRTGRWYVSVADLPVKTRLLRRFIIALGTALVIFAIGLPVIGLWTVAQVIDQQTGGHLSFTSKGVEVQKSVFAKDGTTVHLVPMVHFGEGRFYREVFGSIPTDAVVLAEGLSDDKNLLGDLRPLESLTEALGLEEQVNAQRDWMMNRGAENEENAAGEQPATPRLPRIVRADVDAVDFSDTTVRYLREVGDLYASTSLRDAMDRMSTMNEAYTAEEVELAVREIVDMRNERLLEVFDREASEADLIVIPWGAAHMPGIERGLRERGYALQSREAISVVGYGSAF